MALKWMLPRFRKIVKDQLDAVDAAIPTSAETNASYPSSAYCATTYVKSS